MASDAVLTGLLSNPLVLPAFLAGVLAAFAPRLKPVVRVVEDEWVGMTLGDRL